VSLGSTSRLLIKISRGNNRLYILQTNVSKGVCLGVKSTVVDVECSHARFGHIGYDALH
jgi:hypothetical protein